VFGPLPIPQPNNSFLWPTNPYFFMELRQLKKQALMM
ncbi:unnamed protein product, partial [marine sediment metagenome]